MVSPVSDPAEEFSIQKLSAGCKTALNIYTFKDQTFNIAECGDTAIEVILNLDRGHLYLPHSIPLPRFLPQKAVYTDGEMRIVKDADQLRNILYLNF